MNRSKPVEAVLQVGSAETLYVRGGTGRPVLLLTEEDPRDEARGPLFSTLAGAYRVVCVQVDPSGTSGQWLLDLADGLGLVRPAVVVVRGPGTGPTDPVVSELSALDDCFGPVEIVERGREDHADLLDRMAARWTRSSGSRLPCEVGPREFY